MPTGNGAFVLHQQLASAIDGYSIHPYHPYYTLLPMALPLFSCKHADIIHTSPDYGIFFNKKKSKLVLTFHSYMLDQYMYRYSSPLQRVHYSTDLKLFTRLSMQKADIVTSVSHFTADLVEQGLHPKQDVRVIYNGVDESLFVPENSKKNDSCITVLFSGNATRKKGFDFLPELLPYLNENIRIIFTSGLRDTRTAKVPGRITSIGSIPHSEMPAVYQHADILISPSIREAFGLSVAEAMACGLPIVAFNTSSIPELVEHGHGGYLTDIYDVKSFAGYINKLADSRQLRRQMGEYNRAKVEEKFTLNRMIEEYRLLFEETLIL